MLLGMPVSVYRRAWIGQNLPVKEARDSTVLILVQKKMPISQGMQVISVSEEPAPQDSLVLKFLLV